MSLCFAGKDADVTDSIYNYHIKFQCNAKNNASVNQTNRINCLCKVQRQLTFTASSSCLYNTRSCLASELIVLFSFFGQCAQDGVPEINPWWRHKEHCCLTYVSQVSGEGGTNQVFRHTCWENNVFTPLWTESKKAPRATQCFFNQLSFQPIVCRCTAGVQDKDISPSGKNMGALDNYFPTVTYKVTDNTSGRNRLFTKVLIQTQHR